MHGQGGHCLWGGTWPIVEEGKIPDKLTLDEVTRIEKMAQRTGNPILAETARRAAEAVNKSETEAETLGVHRVIITPAQAAELMEVAIETQDKELADFARYAQSVADTTRLGLEPEPGTIKELTERGKQQLAEMQQKGEQPISYPSGVSGAGVGPVFHTETTTSGKISTSTPTTAFIEYTPELDPGKTNQGPEQSEQQSNLTQQSPPQQPQQPQPQKIQQEQQSQQSPDISSGDKIKQLKQNLQSAQQQTQDKLPKQELSQPESQPESQPQPQQDIPIR